MDDRYFFVHLPKTAGTSMFRVFRDLLGPENVGPMLADFDQVDIEAVSQYRLLGGHLGFQHLHHFGERRVFTMLRHPVDHLVSRYYYYRRLITGASAGVQVQISRDLTLNELVSEEQPETLRFYFNTMVWQLGGMGTASHQSGSETEALRRAKEHLAQCDFVGILEHFADSLDLMSYTFGWPPVETIPRENATSDRLPLESIDSGLLRRIGERNWLDMEIYEYGLSIFKRQKRGMMRLAVRQRCPTDPGPPVPARADRRLTPAPEVVGTSRVKIFKTEVLSSRGRADEICSGEICTVRVLLLAQDNADCVTIGLTIHNNYGQAIFGCRSSAHGVQFSIGRGDVREILFRVPFRLALGRYKINISAFKSDWGKAPDRLQAALAGEPEEIYDYVAGAAEVFISRIPGPRFYGLCNLAPSVEAGDTLALDETFDCELSQPIMFNNSGRGPRHLGTGWSDPEAGGTWTMQHAAHLLFGMRGFPNRDVMLKATIQAFCPESFPSLTADVLVNGRNLSVWRIDGNDTRVQVVRVPAVMTESPFLHVLFSIHDPRSPAATGVSDDKRLLGIGLHQIEFCDAPEGLDEVDGALAI